MQSSKYYSFYLFTGLLETRYIMLLFFPLVRCMYQILELEVILQWTTKIMILVVSTDDNNHDGHFINLRVHSFPDLFLSTVQISILVFRCMVSRSHVKMNSTRVPLLRRLWNQKHSKSYSYSLLMKLFISGIIFCNN